MKASLIVLPAVAFRAAVAAVALLAAILGDAVPASAATLRLQGGVFKAAVSGAAVRIYALRANGTKGPRLAQRTTNAGGGFTAVLSPAPGKPFLVEAAGGSYVDEVSGSVVTLKPTDLMTAIVPPRTKWVTVSPLTHLASIRARALAAAGVPLASAVASSFTGAAQQFNLADTRATVPVDASSADANLLATMEQRDYGLVLAGLSQLAADLGVPAIDLVAALAKDVADGLLDGLENGAPILVPTPGGGTVPLPATAGTADLQAAIDAFIASARNQTHLTAKAIVGVPQSIGAAAGALSVTTTMLPAWLSGGHGTAAIAATGGTPPYACSLHSGSLPAWLSLDGCVLSGTAPELPPGTTRSVSAPFSIAVTDSALAPDRAGAEDVTAQATFPRQFTAIVITHPPQAVPQPGNCFRGVPCNTTSVTATGGELPWSFCRGSFAEGRHPLGTIVDLNGRLVGTPSSPVGRYDYTACVVDAVGWKKCAWTWVDVSLPPTFLLKVGKLGNGRGTVTSTPSGISCGSDCSNRYPLAKVVTLKAVPAADSLFLGWSACPGTGTCTVGMTGNREVYATFAKKSGSVTIASASCNYLRTDFIGGRWVSYFEVVAAGQAVGGAGADLQIAVNPIFGDFFLSCAGWSSDQYSCDRLAGQAPSTGWSLRNAEWSTGFSFDFAQGRATLNAYVFQTGLPTVSDSAEVQCTVPP